MLLLFFCGFVWSNSSCIEVESRTILELSQDKSSHFEMNVTLMNFFTSFNEYELFGNYDDNIEESSCEINPSMISCRDYVLASNGSFYNFVINIYDLDFVNIVYYQYSFANDLNYVNETIVQLSKSTDPFTLYFAKLSMLADNTNYTLVLYDGKKFYLSDDVLNENYLFVNESIGAVGDSIMKDSPMLLEFAVNVSRAVNSSVVDSRVPGSRTSSQKNSEIWSSIGNSIESS